MYSSCTSDHKFLIDGAYVNKGNTSYIIWIYEEKNTLQNHAKLLSNNWYTS